MLGLGYQARAFVWDEQNGMQDLGTLGGTDAQALLVNDRGEVVGWSYNSSAQSALCASFGFGLSLTTGSFIWDKENGMVNLGGIGDTCTLAQGLNNRGQVVGESFLNNDQAGPAFLWERTKGFNVLPTLGGNYADAYSINDKEEAVGGSYLKGNVQIEAALWEKGGVTDLGTLDGDTCAFGFWINASEQVVGISNCFSESTRGFLWEDGGMADLNALIVPGSDFQIPGAFTINDHGEIAAKGVLPDQDEHAILLIPCDENHPGVEGCDYSLVDTGTAPQVNSSSVPQGPISPRRARPGFPGEFNPLLRFGQRLGPRNRALGTQTPTPTSNGNPSASMAADKCPGGVVPDDGKADHLLDSASTYLRGQCIEDNGRLTGSCVAHVFVGPDGCIVKPTCHRGAKAKKPGLTECCGFIGCTHLPVDLASECSL